MAKIFTVSDNESDTSEDLGDSDESEVTPGPASLGAHSLAVPDVRQPGETAWRVRLLSESQASLGRGEDLDEGGSEEGDGAPFRGRSQSAPPALWAAKRYGQQLRRMSDEFDILLDKGGMKRVRSAGAARSMHTSPSWFGFLWSHKETETEVNGGFSAADSRATQ